MMECDHDNVLVFPDLPHAELSADWEYTMRRTMQEIVPNIFLGPYSAASRSQLNVLQSNGITHIVCIRHPLEVKRIKPNFDGLFQYLPLEVKDDADEPIMKYFPLIKEFIDSCLNCQGKVLIHGNGGISRSAALVIAYLMETYGLTYTSAYTYVQKKRFCVNPNEGFVRQLIEYEPIYIAKHQFSLSPQNVPQQSKRPFEDDGEEAFIDGGDVEMTKKTFQSSHSFNVQTSFI